MAQLSLDEVKTVEELKSYFDTRAQSVTDAVEFSISLEDPEVKAAYTEMLKDLDNLESLLDQLDLERKRRRKALDEAKVVVQRYSKLNEAMDAALSQKKDSGPAGGHQAPRRSTVPPSRGSGEQHPEKKTSITEYLEVYENERGHTREAGQSKDEVKVHSTFLFVTEMKHVTEEELEKISRYMRGRLTPEKINVIVDALNQACGAKYEILRTPKSKQSDKIKAAIRDYKEQDIKETAGFNFITEKDITAFTSLKVDKAFLSIVTILRHLGKLKEVRGNNQRGSNLLRYVLL